MKKNKVLFVAILTLGFLTSCNSDDDSGKVNDGNYIVTHQPLNVGVTSAILTGEFYSNKIPSMYSNSTPLSVGMELSLSETFHANEVSPVYARIIEGNQMRVDCNDLLPDTKYYYRAFIDTGSVKLYGEKMSFKTSSMQIACNVEDVTDISYTTATFKIRFNELAPTLSYEGFISGVAYSKSTDYFSNAQTDNKNLRGITFKPVMYSDQNVALEVDDLEAGQTYYYCAFTAAGNRSGVIQFGQVKSFTTESMQELLGIDAVNAKFIVAEITGHTMFSKSMTGLSYIFNYSQLDVDYPLLDEVAMDVDGTSLKAVVQHLNPNNRYECWINVMQNGQKIAQSDKKEFRTQNPGDYILLDDATDITSTTAVINCKLSPYAFEGGKMAHIYFDQDKNNLNRLSTAYLVGDHLSTKLTNLQPNTTYYYRAQALCILSFGWGEWYYSDIKSFTTLP